MGTLWRHPKTEKVGDAALGLLMRILSFCADQGVDTVSEKRMVELFRGSPNGRRQLNQLLAAGFMEAASGGGYTPHDWSEHNRVTKPAKLRLVRDGDEMRLGGLCDDDVMKTPHVIVEERPVSRARPLTQDPGRREEKEREPPTGVAPSAPAAPANERPKEPRKADLKRDLAKRAVSDACAARGLLAKGALSGNQLAQLVGRSSELALREGVEFEVALRRIVGEAAEATQRTGKALCWTVRDWQPVKPTEGAHRAGRGRRVEPAGVSPIEEFGTEEEFYERLRRREEARRAGA